MKCTAVTGSVVVIYISNLITIGSGIEKLKGGGIHRQHGAIISPLLFLQNKESRLKQFLVTYSDTGQILLISEKF
jgi:hypothetical protein